MLATIVDLDAMWKILLAAFAVGVGVTAIFGQGALAAARLATARRERHGGGGVVLDGFSWPWRRPCASPRSSSAASR